MQLKGSRTEENLKAAFASEAQANRRYLYFANKADIEGQNDVSALFRSTAEGETGHAHGHLDYLAEVGDPATGPADRIFARQPRRTGGTAFRRPAPGPPAGPVRAGSAPRETPARQWFGSTPGRQTHRGPDRNTPSAGRSTRRRKAFTVSLEAMC